MIKNGLKIFAIAMIGGFLTGLAAGATLALT